MLNIDRLKLQLNNKPYFSDEEFTVFLDENGLTANEAYTATNKKPLLSAILNVLETLANDIDLFRQVETEFATSTEAFTALSRRIIQVKNQLNVIDDTGITTDNTFSFMYFGGESK